MLVAAALALSQSAPVALLIGIPAPGFVSPKNDLAVVTQALRRRGVPADRIQVIEATADQSLLRAEITGFRGSLLYITGKGDLNANLLEPGVTMPDGGRLGWSAIAAWLPPQPLLLLPDTGYTNTLYSWLPSNGNKSAILSSGSWRSTDQPKQVGTVVHQGETLEVGIFSYILSREIPFATDSADLSYRVTKYLSSGSMAAIWSDLYTVRLKGSGLLPLPGNPIVD